MSKIKFEIAKLLEANGWIQRAEVLKATKSNDQKFDQLRIVLKYKKSGRSVISSIKRISKPGLRVYVKKEELPKVQNNFGLAIISTSKGLMTNKDAKKERVGGEIICEIY